jgi:hypothetical protein
VDLAKGRWSVVHGSDRERGHRADRRIEGTDPLVAGVGDQQAAGLGVEGQAARRPEACGTAAPVGEAGLRSTGERLQGHALDGQRPGQVGWVDDVEVDNPPDAVVAGVGDEKGLTGERQAARMVELPPRRVHWDRLTRGRLQAGVAVTGVAGPGQGDDAGNRVWHDRHSRERRPCLEQRQQAATAAVREDQHMDPVPDRPQPTAAAREDAEQQHPAAQLVQDEQTDVRARRLQDLDRGRQLDPGRIVVVADARDDR